MMGTVKNPILLLFIVMARFGTAQEVAPFRVGIVGLVHSHVGGLLNGGALVPAGCCPEPPGCTSCRRCRT
jgi:hypothetical protein